jgi:hypothetical protein
MAELDDRLEYMPPGAPEPITRLSEYRGERAVCISATQLGPEFSRTEASRIVSEWVEFFSSGRSSIEKLAFVSRTPRRLFESLAEQSQLRFLGLKWGDYEDLSVLESMKSLSVLTLRGASRVRSVAPIAQLSSLDALLIESLRHVRDLSPIAQTGSITALELGGDWMSRRIAHVDSIAFMRQMPQLRSLLLHTIIVDDLDYSPILDLPHLEAVRVMKARGMRPTFEQLTASASWTGSIPT